MPPVPDWPGVLPRQTDRGVVSYTWRVAAKPSLFAAFLSVVLAVMTLAPIDLERRLIDEIAGSGIFANVVVLGVIYLLFQLMQQLLKVSLGIFQDWLTAVLAANMRKNIIVAAKNSGREKMGQRVEVLTSETDHLTQFVGSSFSGAAADLLILIGFIAWMIFIERDIAALSLGVFLPALLVALVIQRYLNELNARRVKLVRRYAGAVADGRRRSVKALVNGVATNQIVIAVLQQVNKAIRNLLIALPTMLILVYGGWLVIQGQTTIGTVVAFVSGFRKLADPLRSLLDFYVDYQKAQVQLRLIADWIAIDSPATAMGASGLGGAALRDRGTARPPTL